MSKEGLKRKAAKLAEKYSKDISCEDLVQEANHITMFHNANFGRTVECIGTVKCFGRVQIRKYISQPQYQFEDVPYSTSHSSISREKLQQA